MYTQNFTGLSASQISELIALVGARAHSWNKVAGFIKVEFDSQGEADQFVQNHEFTEE